MVKLLVIISTSDVEKALTGMMYATNALKNNWVEDVEVFFFGPIEKKIADGNEKLIPWIEELARLKTPYACKRIADNESITDDLTPYAKVIYVGSVISNLMDQGYVPMVF